MAPSRLVLNQTCKRHARQFGEIKKKKKIYPLLVLYKKKPKRKQTFITLDKGICWILLLCYSEIKWFRSWKLRLKYQDILYSSRKVTSNNNFSILQPAPSLFTYPGRWLKGRQCDMNIFLFSSFQGSLTTLSEKLNYWKQSTGHHNRKHLESL